jgi:chromosome segregation ATPase
MITRQCITLYPLCVILDSTLSPLGGSHSPLPPLGRGFERLVPCVGAVLCCVGGGGRGGGGGGGGGGGEIAFQMEAAREEQGGRLAAVQERDALRSILAHGDQDREGELAKEVQRLTERCRRVTVELESSQSARADQAYALRTREAECNRLRGLLQQSSDENNRMAAQLSDLQAQHSVVVQQCDILKEDLQQAQQVSSGVSSAQPSRTRSLSASEVDLEGQPVAWRTLRGASPKSIAQEVLRSSLEAQAMAEKEALRQTYDGELRALRDRVAKLTSELHESRLQVLAARQRPSSPVASPLSGRTGCFFPSTSTSPRGSPADEKTVASLRQELSSTRAARDALAEEVKTERSACASLRGLLAEADTRREKQSEELERLRQAAAFPPAAAPDEMSVALLRKEVVSLRASRDALAAEVKAERSACASLRGLYVEADAQRKEQSDEVEKLRLAAAARSQEQDGLAELLAERDQELSQLRQRVSDLQGDAAHILRMEQLEALLSEAVRRNVDLEAQLLRARQTEYALRSRIHSEVSRGRAAVESTLLHGMNISSGMESHSSILHGSLDLSISTAAQEVDGKVEWVEVHTSGIGVSRNGEISPVSLDSETEQDRSIAEVGDTVALQADSLVELAHRLSHMKQEMQRVEHERDLALQSAASASRAADDSSSRATVLQGELRASEAALAAAHLKLLSAQDSAESLKALQEEKSAWNGSRVDLEAGLALAKESIAQLESQLASMQNRATVTEGRWEAEVGNLKARLTVELQLSSSLRHEVWVLTERLAEAQDQDDCESSCTAVPDLSAELKAQNETLMGELALEIEKARLLLESRDSLSMEIAEAREQLVTLQGELHEERASLADATQRGAYLEEQLSQLDCDLQARDEVEGALRDSLQTISREKDDLANRLEKSVLETAKARLGHGMRANLAEGSPARPTAQVKQLQREIQRMRADFDAMERERDEAALALIANAAREAEVMDQVRELASRVRREQDRAESKLADALKRIDLAETEIAELSESRNKLASEQRQAQLHCAELEARVTGGQEREEQLRKEMERQKETQSSLCLKMEAQLQSEFRVRTGLEAEVKQLAQSEHWLREQLDSTTDTARCSEEECRELRRTLDTLTVELAVSQSKLAVQQDAVDRATRAADAASEEVHAMYRKGQELEVEVARLRNMELGERGWADLVAKMASAEAASASHTAMAASAVQRLREAREAVLASGLLGSVPLADDDDGIDCDQDQQDSAGSEDYDGESFAYAFASTCASVSAAAECSNQGNNDSYASVLYSSVDATLDPGATAAASSQHSKEADISLPSAARGSGEELGREVAQLTSLLQRVCGMALGTKASLLAQQQRADAAESEISSLMARGHTAEGQAERFRQEAAALGLAKATLVERLKEEERTSSDREKMLRDAAAATAAAHEESDLLRQKVERLIREVRQANEVADEATANSEELRDEMNRVSSALANATAQIASLDLQVRAHRVHAEEEKASPALHQALSSANVALAAQTAEGLQLRAKIRAYEQELAIMRGKLDDSPSPSPQSMEKVDYRLTTTDFDAVGGFLLRDSTESHNVIVRDLQLRLDKAEDALNGALQASSGHITTLNEEKRRWESAVKALGVSNVEDVAGAVQGLLTSVDMANGERCRMEDELVDALARAEHAERRAETLRAAAEEQGQTQLDAEARLSELSSRAESAEAACKHARDELDDFKGQLAAAKAALMDAEAASRAAEVNKEKALDSLKTVSRRLSRLHQKTLGGPDEGDSIVLRLKERLAEEEAANADLSGVLNEAIAEREVLRQRVDAGNQALAVLEDLKFRLDEADAQNEDLSNLLTDALLERDSWRQHAAALVKATGETREAQLSDEGSRDSGGKPDAREGSASDLSRLLHVATLELDVLQSPIPTADDGTLSSGDMEMRLLQERRLNEKISLQLSTAEAELQALRMDAREESNPSRLALISRMLADEEAINVDLNSVLDKVLSERDALRRLLGARAESHLVETINRPCPSCEALIGHEENLLGDIQRRIDALARTIAVPGVISPHPSNLIDLEDPGDSSGPFGPLLRSITTVETIAAEAYETLRCQRSSEGVESLRSALEEREQEASYLRTQLESTVSESASKDKHIERVTEQLVEQQQDLQERLDSEERLRKAAEADAHQLSEGCQSLQMRVEASESAIESLRLRLLQSAEREKAEVEEVSFLRKALADKELELQSHAAALEAKAIGDGETRKTIGLLQTELQLSRSKVQALSNLLKKQEQRFEEAGEAWEVTRSRAESVERLSDKIIELETRASGADALVDTLRARLDAALHDLTDARGRADKSEAACLVLTEESRSARDQISALRSYSKEITQRLEQSETARKAAESLADALRQANDELSMLVGRADEEGKKLAAEVSHLERCLQTTTEDLERTLERCRLADDKVQSLSGEKEKLRQQRDEAQSQATEVSRLAIEIQQGLPDEIKSRKREASNLLAEASMKVDRELAISGALRGKIFAMLCRSQNQRRLRAAMRRLQEFAWTQKIEKTASGSSADRAAVLLAKRQFQRMDQGRLFRQWQISAKRAQILTLQHELQILRAEMTKIEDTVSSFEVIAGGGLAAALPDRVQHIIAQSQAMRAALVAIAGALGVDGMDISELVVNIRLAVAAAEERFDAVSASVEEWEIQGERMAEETWRASQRMEDIMSTARALVPTSLAHSLTLEVDDRDGAGGEEKGPHLKMHGMLTALEALMASIQSNQDRNQIEKDKLESISKLRVDLQATSAQRDALKEQLETALGRAADAEAAAAGAALDNNALSKSKAAELAAANRCKVLRDELDQLRADLRELDELRMNLSRSSAENARLLHVIESLRTGHEITSSPRSVGRDARASFTLDGLAVVEAGTRSFSLDVISPPHSRGGASSRRSVSTRIVELEDELSRAKEGKREAEAALARSVASRDRAEMRSRRNVEELELDRDSLLQSIDELERRLEEEQNRSAEAQATAARLEIDLQSALDARESIALGKNTPPRSAAGRLASQSIRASQHTDRRKRRSFASDGSSLPGQNRVFSRSKRSGSGSSSTQLTGALATPNSARIAPGWSH